MIYFSLPNLYNHIGLLLSICDLNKRLEVMKTPVQFVSIDEPIPFCYLCGGINYNKDHILQYTDLQNTSETRISTLAKRLNFSNLYIDEQDLTDEYFNIVLDFYGNNFSNWIEVSNLSVATILKEKNISFELIFSSNADILHPINEDIINTILEQNIFKLISLPYYLDFNKFNLKNIVTRSKIELTVNNICQNCSIPCQQSCIKNEHSLIYDYSHLSKFLTCPNFLTYNNQKTILISLEEIQNIYLPLGIHHYKLNNFPDAPNAFIDFIFFFVNYFIKEEYQNEILLHMLKENK